jgi:hypothetical protein
MPDSLKVDVAYTLDDRWVAEIAPDFDQPFEQDSLIELIAAVQKAWPDEDLAFTVDADSILGHPKAQIEFREAAMTSGAAVKESRKAFGADTVS